MHKTKILIFIIIFLSGSLFAIVIPADASTPPQSGDWVIGSAEDILSQNQIVNGSLIIDSTEQVRIINSNLTIYGDLIIRYDNHVIDSSNITLLGGTLVIGEFAGPSQNILIKESRIISNTTAIEIDSGTFTNLQGNYIESTGQYTFGIEIWDDYNNITGNEIFAPRYTIDFNGDHNIIKNNLINSSSNSYATIYMGGTNQTLIGNTIESGEDGLYSSSSLSNHTLVNNTITAGAAAITFNGQNTIIENNIINSGEDGIDVGGSNNYIFNNTVNARYYNGISTGSGGIIANNTVYVSNTQSSFIWAAIDTGNNNLVENNTVYNSDGYGISLSSSSNTIVRNNFVQSYDSAINFLFGLDNIVEDNILHSTNSYGIDVDGTNNQTIRSNVINGTTGIYVLESAFINITENEIYGYSSHGVTTTIDASWAGSKYIWITNNSIFGASEGVFSHLYFDNSTVIGNYIEAENYGIGILSGEDSVFVENEVHSKNLGFYLDSGVENNISYNVFYTPNSTLDIPEDNYLTGNVINIIDIDPPKFIDTPNSKISVEIGSIVDLSWDIRDDFADTYLILLNGEIEKFGSYAGIQVNLTLDLEVGEYNITLIANDTSGNWISDYVNVTINPETVNPTISSPDDISTDDLDEFIVEWSVQDEHLDSYQFIINGTAMSTIKFTSNSTTVGLGFSKLSVGTYNITIYVNDTFGNEAVDELFIYISSSDVYSPEISVVGDMNYRLGETITLNTTVSDPSNGTIYFYVNGILQSDMQFEQSYTFEISELAEYIGQYNFTIVVIDTWGNTNIEEVIVTVIEPDTTAPNISISGKTTVIVGETISLTITITDESNGVASIYTNGEMSSTSSFQQSIVLNINQPTSDMGSYNFTVVASDEYGNENIRQIIVTITNETTASSPLDSIPSETGQDSFLFFKSYQIFLSLSAVLIVKKRN